MKSGLDLHLLGTAKSVEELEMLAKEAGFASFAGGILDKVAPETTKEYIRPMWQGMKTQWNAGSRSPDGLLSGGLKSIEANRFNRTGIGQKLNDFGVKVNKDMHGRPVYDNMINFDDTFNNLKSNVGSWLSNLPGMASKALPFIGGLTSSFFNQQPQQTSTLNLNQGPKAYAKFGG